ncbi:hypothetical protein [Nostoc sp. C057]|nr:hypothetical protein [Nostoc sp. C057]
MAKPAGEKVPKQMEGKFEEITRLTDDQYLLGNPLQSSRIFAV